MAYCTGCGQKLDDQWSYCGSCGNSREPAVSRKAIKAWEDEFRDRRRMLAGRIFSVVLFGALVALGIAFFNQVSNTDAKTPDLERSIAHHDRPVTIKVGNETVPVQSRHYSYFSFTVDPSWRNVYLSGTFRAAGGSNDIEVYLVDETGFVNFANGNQFRSYYSSGRVTLDNVNVGPLGPRTYYLVFANTWSLMTDKVVDNQLSLHYIVNESLF